MLFRTTEKERTNYVIRERVRAAPDRPKLFLGRVPKDVKAEDTYWKSPKTTTIGLYAQFFSTQDIAQRFIDSMNLGAHWEPHAIIYTTRPCYSGPTDLEFVQCKAEVKKLAETLLAECEKNESTTSAPPDATKARLACKQLNILLDIYDDWEHSQIPYDAEEEIQFLSLLARLYWYPLSDLQLLNGAVNRIAHRLRKSGHPFHRDDLWREYVRVTPAQRQAYINRFRIETNNKSLPLPGANLVNDSGNSCKHSVPVQQ